MNTKVSKNRKELLLKLINRTTPRAHDNRDCTYDQDYNGGCAIGCEISYRLSKILRGNVSDVLENLPKRLQNMGEDFLIEVQTVHDHCYHWINTETAEKGEDGLVWNETGKERINSIIKRYNLNIQPLKI